ncbi:MAG: NADH-quinone oxidoreductase subunit NuoG [Pseudomonadota bacterium]|nr:NADH-quinone oxidoreductase subunit NuoG [Pseudomonadota bacterium]
MPKLTINGHEIEVEAGTSVLQACQKLGIEIPHFCYHERLSVPANCRMCLVEMEKAPKPIASCAMPCSDNMVIKTDSPLVHKARKGVMEFLLINHPLDCPICDQGGECDLQDQAVAYGFDRSRYTEEKRAVTDKNLGPLIETHMTRCIQCTRCIRFSDEIAGVSDLGAVNRGEHMEITTYIEKAIDSELSGNLIDVCPVGALVSKPYAFTARPWELRKVETVDVMDAVGSNIRVDVRGGEVMRVLPRLHEDVNEEWISDKTRFHVDGLKRQRLDRPYVRRNGKLQPATWDEAFAVITEKVKATNGSRMAALAGDLCDAESMVALKDLMIALGSPHLDCRQDGARFDVTQRAGYLFNTTITGIEKADAIMLIGTNPRIEAAIINARIRKRTLMGGLRVGVIGPKIDLNYRYDYLGDGPAVLQGLIERMTVPDAKKPASKNPMIILGMGALQREDGLAVHAAARTFAEATGIIRDDWNGFNVLHTAAARVGALDLGFVPGAKGLDTNGILNAAGKGDLDIVYLLGADEIDTSRLGKAFVIYQGHHGDRGAHRADVILPGATWTEKNGTYVNTEGRVQQARQAAFPLGEAKEDWKILRALSEKLGKTLPYDNLSQVRKRLVAVNPVFGQIDTVKPAPWTNFGQPGTMNPAPFGLAIDNFYLTNPITRASTTMAECVDVFEKKTAKTGT